MCPAVVASRSYLLPGRPPAGTTPPPGQQPRPERSPQPAGANPQQATSSPQPATNNHPNAGHGRSPTAPTHMPHPPPATPPPHDSRDARQGGPNSHVCPPARSLQAHRWRGHAASAPHNPYRPRQTRRGSGRLHVAPHHAPRDPVGGCCSPQPSADAAPARTPEVTHPQARRDRSRASPPNGDAPKAAPAGGRGTDPARRARMRHRTTGRGVGAVHCRHPVAWAGPSAGLPAPGGGRGCWGLRGAPPLGALRGRVGPRGLCVLLSQLGRWDL